MKEISKDGLIKKADEFQQNYEEGHKNWNLSQHWTSVAMADFVQSLKIEQSSASVSAKLVLNEYW